MAIRLELSRRAEADLDEIRDYSVEHFGVPRAIAYLDAIEQAFRRIVSFPGAGALHSTVEPPVRSLACERHRIFYNVEGEVILIPRVLHGAMDAERHL